MNDSRTLALARPHRLVVLARNLAFHDWVCVLFHGYMLARVLAAPDSADATAGRAMAAALLTITLTAIAIGRGELLPKGSLRAVIYRAGVFVPVALSYFELRELLAAVSPVLYDPQLEAIDRLLFGTPPAIWLQRFNRPAIIEWFSFFYYSYYIVVAAVLLPSIVLERGRRLREATTGAVLVVAIGHACYTLVPAAGPVIAYPFAEPTHGGFFFGIVEHAVLVAGAQLDVFPSLHTALPTFLALHCYGQRHRAPYRYAWPLLAFIAANIIVATLLLRWHWGIDIVCGLALAAAARTAAVRIARCEGRRGIDDDRQPTWEPILAIRRTQRALRARLRSCATFPRASQSDRRAR